MLLDSGSGADNPAGARRMARATFASPLLRPRPRGWCIRTRSRVRRGCGAREPGPDALPEAASEPGFPAPCGDARAGRGYGVASAALPASRAATPRRKGPDGSVCPELEESVPQPALVLGKCGAPRLSPPPLLPLISAAPGSGTAISRATKQFLEEINKWTGQYNVSPLSWNVAVKFLMARKFDVLRAIELFHSYRETRLKEGIVKLKPHEEPLRSELLSGKFTILSVRDPSGASIALFTAKLHHPSKSVQHVVLQALFYLLDRAVESFETQRNGLVFIYDMAGSQYTNFELDLSKKILNLLKGAFPARLKKVFIVGAPMWFRVPYSIISLLLKEKLRERVQMVKMSELKEHLPRECLPEYLGGSLKLDPLSWNCRFLPQQNGHPDPLDELILVPLVAPKDNGSVHVPGPKSVTLQELLDHVSHKQKRGIYEEYEDIRRRSPAGTFVCSLAPYNQEKNRYGDVPCLDQTRVKLAKPYSRPELTDYINASFMDGYKQRNAYIGTQGPLENTYGDFWRMVWEQNVLVIVMTTRLEEGGRRKCGQYWPLEKDFQVCFGALTITNLGVENLNHYKKTILEIHSSETRERRLVSHFQYLSWPDYGVPSSAATLIDFLGAVKQQQRVAVSSLGPRFKGHPGGPPIVVHCSAGIGRTGTFCALDICLSQLQDVGTLNIYQTVLRMRTQRAFSIQTPEQYYFCYTAVLEHAQREGLLLANHSRAGQEKSSPGH
ncbi:tyrosine-protein phosphatase non-receptor type 9 isoform X1 [Balearica regulorum gibbericeps]|uniref:tyrosine-protein phosphatase non-receptor type 9 isoform X1 n=1 Tax=Balearica regulorum gibbericeps TaxID=100784 RepID=UPI003F61D590